MHSLHYRPPVGVPERKKQSRWQGWLFSLLAHLLLIGLIILPAISDNTNLSHAEGAGGAGPAGGGGGGSRGGNGNLGNGGEQRIHYVQAAPSRGAPDVPVVAPVAPVTPPVVKVPEPVVRPPATPQATTLPKAPVAPPVKTEQPTAVPSVSAPQNPSSPTGASGAGDGGESGTGSRGGSGAGSGSGGGVGSGDGTGRGSGVGAGTGGGNAENYPPTPSQVFLPPLPAPQKVRGFKLTAWFDVDSTGKSTLLRFTPSPDAGYNKKLKETLLAMKFRPAVRPDGTAIRDTVDVQFVF